MKRCTKCRSEKAESDFYYGKSWCKSCWNVASRRSMNRRRAKQYGVSWEFIENLWETQGKVCSICYTDITLEPQSRSERNSNAAYIDHCHEEDEIRGLLCGKCNTGLGMFDDSQSVLLRAAKYLKEFYE